MPPEGAQIPTNDDPRPGQTINQIQKPCYEAITIDAGLSGWRSGHCDIAAGTTNAWQPESKPPEG